MSIDDVYRTGDDGNAHVDRIRALGPDNDTVWLPGPMTAPSGSRSRSGDPTDTVATDTDPTGTHPTDTHPTGTTPPHPGPASGKPIPTEPASGQPTRTEPTGGPSTGGALPADRQDGSDASVTPDPLDDLTDDPADDFTDTPSMIRRHLHARKPGPFRRFVLYASGVDTRVLWYAPIDETEFVVQGTLVTLTALVAALSGTAASSFLVAGRFELSPVTVAVGLVWGLLIFFFDRALVAGTFNAYRFNRREVETLRDAAAGSVWAHLLDDGPDRRRLVRRAGEIVRVAVVASLRVALALATSFIAAEMVLFLIFQPEISQRAAYIEQQTQAQRIAAIQTDFKVQSDKRAAEREQLSGGRDPDVVRLQAQSATLTKQLATARHDLEILQAGAAAELDGTKFQAKLSDGTIVKTTGLRGDGAAAQSLAARRDTQQQLVGGLSTQLTQTTTSLNTKLTQIEKTNAPALKALDALDNQAAATQQAQIDATSADPSAVKGLLVRQAALNQLINDRNPDTVAPDPVKPCGGLCGLRNWLLPPTPMGPIVIAYRLIFFVIEILPITYKVIASLRRRRPYDAVKAALEEAAVADSIRLADRHLHEAAAEMAARAHLRQVRAAEMAAGRRR